MRTRLVRVRKRPRGVVWAVVILALAMALYIRVSLPALKQMQAEEASAVGRGERVTREIEIEGLRVWLISFGEYAEKSGAKVEAARYVPRGAAGYVLEGERFSVIGAGYEVREDAEKVCVQLEAEEGIECGVVEMSASLVKMRMTAGSEQIAAFLEAEKALRSAAGALGQLAFSVDRGEAGTGQAAEVIRTHLGRIRSSQEALRAQTGDGGGEVIEGLAGMLDDLTEQMEEMTKEAGAMALSSRLKYCYVEFRIREIEWLNGLDG